MTQVKPWDAAHPPTGFTEPELIKSAETGVGPDNILFDPDCTVVAAANEGEGGCDLR